MSLPALVAWCSAPPSSDPSDLPARARSTQRAQESQRLLDQENASQSLPPSDERLLFERITLGDESAFETVYLALYVPLRSFAFVLTQNEAVAHDIVQDVFLAFWRDRTRIELRERFVPYLYKAIRNQAAKARRHDRVVRATESQVGVAETVPGMGSTADEIDHEIENRELHAALIKAVEELPDGQRVAVTLLITQMLSAVEIAGVLGISVAAVHMNLFRARATLKIILEKFAR